MSNELFNQMLSAYDLATHQQKRNATFEVNQQIILAGLYNGGFFNEAAFYGGTCLRLPWPAAILLSKVKHYPKSFWQQP